MVMGGDDEERSTSVGIIKTNSEQEIKHGGVKQDAVTPSHVRTPVCMKSDTGSPLFFPINVTGLRAGTKNYNSQGVLHF